MHSCRIPSSVLLAAWALLAAGCVTDGEAEMVPAKDMAVAWSWLPDPAAILPEPGEDVELALRYLNGEGVIRNADIAHQLLRGAAERGDGEAAFLLGRLYEEGVGVDQDGEEAMRWIEKAAARRYDLAQFRLGTAYYRGEGRPLNPAKGVRWLLQAADAGHAEAQYHLAIAYHLGRGTARNEVEAVRWLEAAAAQNHLKAQYLAGDAHSDGWGARRDHSWAARWYGRAAARGLASAQYKLALFHFGGLGVPHNRIEAYKWASIAAEKGLADARRLLRRLEQEMKPADIERAGQRVLEQRTRRPVAGRDSVTVADQPSVAFAQFALRQLGYRPGDVDGDLGQQTRHALAAYQRANGMVVDGRLSPALLRRLKSDRLKRLR